MSDQMRSVPGPPVQGPVPGQFTGQARTSHAWLWWLGGCGSLGCLVLIAFVISAVFFGGNVLFDRAAMGVLNCLPGDFPNYPGSSVLDYKSTLNWPSPGGTCRMSFVTGDSESRVYAFYESNLSTGNWRVTSAVPAGDASGGQITFEGRKTGGPHGTVLVGPYGGDKARIVVRVDT